MARLITYGIGLPLVSLLNQNQAGRPADSTGTRRAVVCASFPARPSDSGIQVMVKLAAEARAKNAAFTPSSKVKPSKLTP